MVLLVVLLGIVIGIAAGVVVAALVLRPAPDDGSVAGSMAAALGQLTVEREQAMAAMREQLTAERLELAVERERITQATIDTVLSVAGDKLSSHSASASRELEMRGEAIDQRVTGMNDELRRVRQLVIELQKEKAEQHGQFVQGINEAIRATATLTDTAQSLREALSNSRARGQWGERMADDVLRAAGLVEGVSYRRQQTLPGGTRPDFTFVLPRGRFLHMDVKFPIDNYLRSLDASDDAGRDHHARAFLKDVQARVRELATREYVDPDTTVGYVLLFIPNEAVYAFIHEHAARLVDDALGQQVILCSPFSLFAVLGVVRQAVDNFLVERTSTEILECLAGFGKQWGAFSEKLDRLGSQFATAQKSYDELAGTRRRQLQRQLDRVERLRTMSGLGDLEALDDLDVHDDLEPLAHLEPADEHPRAVGEDTGTGLPPGRRIARLRPLR